MPHESKLIALIAVGFVLALAFGFLAARVRLPPLVGYLVAGIAIGPFTPGFVADTNLAAEVAEIGVILLMFGVGLHFSISAISWRVRGHRDFRAQSARLPDRDRWSAPCLARFWGWPSCRPGSRSDSRLSVASTVVLLRALEQRRPSSSRQDGRIAVGWLIVEDLAMVLALVLLPALAQTFGGEPAGAVGLAMSGSSACCSALAHDCIREGRDVRRAAMLDRRPTRGPMGARSRIARTGSRELFTLAVLAIALGIAFGSAASLRRVLRARRVLRWRRPQPSRNLSQQCR